MQIEFAFGRQGLTLPLPDTFRYQVLEARSAQPVPDAAKAIESALDNPIGTPALRALAEGKQSAAISVCDITRPAPNRLVLPPLLARLHAAGIPAERITMCIATGLHREATEAEIDEILGPEIARAYPIVNHNARLLEEHTYLGETSTGTPVYIDSRFLQADLHITLGFIEPHLMLGFSGGRKLIAPGLAAKETIQVLHSPKFMRDARAVEGSVEENPLHRELLEISRLARHDFIVDAALTRQRGIAGIFAGNPVEAHRQGMQFVSRVLLEMLDAPVDLAITSAAGYPLDMTFYQAIKGVTAASHIVKDGGRILVIAECREGAGAPEFREMMRRCRTSAEFLDLLRDAPVVIDQWQLEKLALVTERVDVEFFVPGLEAEYQSALWGPAYPTIHEAIQGALRGLSRDARIALLPDGPYVLAKAEQPELVAG